MRGFVTSDAASLCVASDHQDGTSFVTKQPLSTRAWVDMCVINAEASAVD